MTRELIESTRQGGKEVCKQHELIFCGNRIIFEDKTKFYIEIDTDVIIDKKTRIFVFEKKDGMFFFTSANVIGCSVFNPYSKQYQDIEAVKLVAAGVYAVYSDYYINKRCRLRFTLDREISEPKLVIYDFYVVGSIS